MLPAYARGIGLPTKKVVNMKKQVENIIRHSEVSEKAIEAYLVRRCKESGLLCLKYSNANTTGYPDRVVCLPHCNVVWVELKSKGKKPTKLQEIRHQELRELGHQVFVIDSKEGVDKLISDTDVMKEYLNSIHE